MYNIKCLLSLLTVSLLANSLSAQNVYTIKADSVKLTNCDSSELIIENHTQGVKGFLYNTGNGRTIFKNGAVKINDSLYLIGADSLIAHVPSNNFWSLSGNLGVDPATQYFGSRDCNPVSFRVCAVEKMRLFSTGNFGINTGGVDYGGNYKLQVGGNVLATGTSHLIGSLAITNGSDVGGATATGIRIDGSDYTSFIFEGSVQSAAKNMFVFTDAFGGIGMDVNQDDQSIVRIKSGFRSSNGSNNASVLHVNPNYQFSTSTGPATLRGIYYNPIITSLPSGTKHIALETVVGNVLLGTGSGNTLLGTSTDGGQKLQVNGNAYISGSLAFPANSSTSQLRLGSLELQGYGIGNSWYGDNIYYNGAGFVYRNSGPATLMRHIGGDMIFQCAPSGTAGGAASLINVLHLFNTGNVQINNGAGSSDLANAKLQVISSGNQLSLNNSAGGSTVLSANINGQLNMLPGSIGVGINTATPTAQLHLPAGTAGSGTSPLKFTAGTNLTTPENGTVEFDGTHFSSTQGGVRRQLDQQAIAGSYSHAGSATTTFTVTIGITQANTLYKVSVTPTASLSAASFYVANKTTTTFDVVYLSGLSGTVTFDWTVFP